MTRQDFPLDQLTEPLAAIVRAMPLADGEQIDCVTITNDCGGRRIGTLAYPRYRIIVDTRLGDRVRRWENAANSDEMMLVEDREAEDGE